MDDKGEGIVEPDGSEGVPTAINGVPEGAPPSDVALSSASPVASSPRQFLSITSPASPSLSRQRSQSTSAISGDHGPFEELIEPSNKSPRRSPLASSMYAPKPVHPSSQLHVLTESGNTPSATAMVLAPVSLDQPPSPTSSTSTESPRLDSLVSSPSPPPPPIGRRSRGSRGSATNSLTLSSEEFAPVRFSLTRILDSFDKLEEAFNESQLQRNQKDAATEAPELDPSHDESRGNESNGIAHDTVCLAADEAVVPTARLSTVVFAEGASLSVVPGSPREVPATAAEEEVLDVRGAERSTIAATTPQPNHLPLGIHKGHPSSDLEQTFFDRPPSERPTASSSRQSLSSTSPAAGSPSGPTLGADFSSDHSPTARKRVEPVPDISGSSDKIQATRKHNGSVQRRLERSPSPHRDAQVNSTSKKTAPTTAITRLPGSNSSNVLRELWGLLHGELVSSDFDESHDMKKERVQNFLMVPLEFERLMSLGFFICMDSFLYIFTILPLRILIAAGSILKGTMLRTRKLKAAQKCDLLRGALVILCWLMLEHVDASRLYHSIRLQATIKLYVIFNVLEICDKLCSAFGHDILDSLFSKTTVEFTRMSSSASARRISRMTHFVVALFYVFAHSMVLFYQVMTLNAAINSHNSSLLTLLISNQFIEIKGSVFKKFERENLFQLCCSDIVERFQLSIFLAIITGRNFVEFVGGEAVDSFFTSVFNKALSLVSISTLSEWIHSIAGSPFSLYNFMQSFIKWISSVTISNVMENGPTALYSVFRLALEGLGSNQLFSDPSAIIHGAVEDVMAFYASIPWSMLWGLFGPVLMVYATEILVDWLKHAFITKFNQIRPSVYSRFSDSLCRDLIGLRVVAGSTGEVVVTEQMNAAGRSPAVARRIGFVSIPLSCLILRFSMQTFRMVLAAGPTLPPLPKSAPTSFASTSSIQPAGQSFDFTVQGLDGISSSIQMAQFIFNRGLSMMGLEWFGNLGNLLTYESVSREIMHRGLYDAMWLLFLLLGYTILVIIKLVIGLTLHSRAYNRIQCLSYGPNPSQTGSEKARRSTLTDFAAAPSTLRAAHDEAASGEASPTTTNANTPKPRPVSTSRQLPEATQKAPVDLILSPRDFGALDSSVEGGFGFAKPGQPLAPAPNQAPDPSIPDERLDVVDRFLMVKSRIV
ncbi:eukaryotic membrane protein family-domain-containing protein [Zopfochytrium polystomum]|nr:eukaryotic membrane protein family-domain-containing protein [Zopfochytrium polystomum]